MKGRGISLPSFLARLGEICSLSLILELLHVTGFFLFLSVNNKH